MQIPNVSSDQLSGRAVRCWDTSCHGRGRCWRRVGGQLFHFKPFHYNLSIKYPFFSAKMSKTWFQQGGPGGGFISCTKEVPGPPICNKLTKKIDHLHWKCISSVAPYCISYSADSARSPSQNRRQM